MANFNIPENPEYTSEVRKFETTDPAHADLFNAVTQVLLNNDTFLKQVTEQLIKNVNQHIKDTENPHEMTAEQLNLEKVDNTSDLEKPVSTVQQNALDALYQQMTQYTDKEIADLINGAPGTLDTLGEIAEAMQENEDVVTALEQAIGIKASKAEMESALAGKLDKTGDAQDNTVTFTSADVADGGTTAWTIVAKLTTSEKLSSVLNKVSVMFKNIRYLYKMLGTTDISAIGGGTVTGAISKLNTDLVMNITNETYSSTHYTHQTPVLIYFTVPYDGYYLVTALVTYEKNANGYREIFLKNTVTDNITGRNMMPAITDSYTTLQVVSGTPFAPGQYGTLQLYQNSGANLSVTGWINMVKIAPR